MKQENEIVISGIAGRFPDSDSVDEFKELLFNNVDLVTEDERRWPLGLFGIPNRFGKIRDLSKFDAQFFGISGKAAMHMDPQIRMLLESTYEAIADAGINPQTLRGTNTGVFIGVVSHQTSDMESISTSETSFITGYRLTGGCHSMFANHISFKFDFKGPSCAINTGNTSSFAALEHAIINIRGGLCDAAIVGGVNICVKSITSLYLNIADMLSIDGKCKFLDESANGFARSEACSVIFLQKKVNAYRIYASILSIKSNNCGYTESSMPHSIIKSQSDLIKETIKEANVNPSEVEFIEAYGSGSKDQDLIECKAISNAYCQNRLDPILLGSVKTNMGHSEAASGLCSLIKVLLSFENDCIPANLHFKSPNHEIPELMNGLMKPIVSNTRFTGSIVGINCFNNEGINSHLIVKSHFMKKMSDNNNNILVETIPRLIPICGRTEQSVNFIINFIEQNPEKVTKEFLGLLNNVSKTLEPNSMFYRGFMLAKKYENSELTMYSKEISHLKKRRQLWFFFSGLGSEWKSMAKWMLKLDNIANTLKKCSAVLKQYDIDLYKYICSEENTPQSLVTTTVSIIAVQIALNDFFKYIGINADGIVGHSMGELSCAYADGCISLENTLHVAYCTAKCIEDARLPRGVMAMVGLSVEEAKRRCPQGVDIGCHNTKDLVTISGEYNIVTNFIEELKADNIFTRLLNSCDTALHSNHMSSIESSIIKCLEKYISPVKRSNRWISSSVAVNPWNETRGKYFSADYVANTIISSVQFYEAIQNVPKDSVIIELSPHSLLKANLKSILGTDMVFIDILRKNNSKGNIDMLLSAIGRLYNLGFNPNVENLYPKVEYPVSRGTQSIGSLVKWDHSQEWLVMLYPEYMNPDKSKNSEEVIDLQKPDSKYIAEYRIDNCVFVPSSVYLWMVWKLFAKIKSKFQDQIPVEFRNVIIHRIEPISTTKSINYLIELMTTSGEFIITENDEIIMTGQIFVLENDFLNLQNYAIYKSDLKLTHNDIYNEFPRRGYNFGQAFQTLIELNSDLSYGKIKWTHNWITFIESFFQIGIFAKQTQELCFPLKFQYIRYNPELVSQALIKSGSNNTMDVYFDPISNIFSSNGVEIKGLEFKSISRKRYIKHLSDSLSFDSFNQIDTNDENLIETEHAYIDMTAVSHMSNVRWHESSNKIWRINSDKKSKYDLCAVYYSSFNSDDILMPLRNCTLDSLSKDINLCLEFTGRDQFGKRIMGLQLSNCLSTTITIDDQSFLWSIPDQWSMEEACTIPYAYSTAYYALILRGNLISGESVLIHCGSSGIGQAAISICLSMGCQVFTTVENEQKKDYLKKQFPQLNDQHFGNCEDTSFELDIMRATNHKGVDVLLNPLSGKLLKASLNCVGEHGRFLQIGKLDLKQDNRLYMSVFLKNITFHGIIFEDILVKQNPMIRKVLKSKQQIYKFVQNGINNGVIRPLKRKIITTDQIMEGFNFAFNDKKTIVKIREEEREMCISPKPLVFKAIPKTIFHSNQTYILTEALNEFGFTLSEWLVKRGATKLVFNSRTDTMNALQQLYIKTLEQMGAEIIISKTDPSSIDGTLKLINEAKRCGEIGGIFMILNNSIDECSNDGISKSVDNSNFSIVEEISNLDSVTRKLPDLQYFVIFSFFGCVNNTNNNASIKRSKNSMIERICALRQRNGFPGLSVNFGDDKRSQIENDNDSVETTLSGRIYLFLSAFDKLLHSKQTSIRY